MISTRSIAELRWLQVAPERFRTGVLVSFAVSATFLALVGLFSVVAYSVVQRTREIGLRMALGARGRDIQQLIVTEALLPTACGLIIGVMAALGLSRLIGSMLYGLSPIDPIAYGIATMGLMAASVAASAWPARRVTRIDPMLALRSE